MNNFIHCIDGFKKVNIYYTDTDSLYIHKSYWKKLDEAGFVGNDLLQGKNDYGNGGIIFGLYIASKIKYNIVIDDNFHLSEKKTFKGYNNNFVTSENFVQLFNNQTLETEVNSPWKHSLSKGVILPENEKMKKKFSSEINKLKRQPPGKKHFVMLPYNSKDEGLISIDEKEVRSQLFIVEENPELTE